MRLALAQVNPHVGDVDGNADRVLAAWRRADELGADLVCLPELVLTGYPPGDLIVDPEVVAANRRALDDLAVGGPAGCAAVVGFVDQIDSEAAAGDWDVSIPARDDLRNAAAVLGDGRIVGAYHKGRLPTYGVFDEARWFTPGRDPLVVGIAGVPVGITVCEDLWAETGPLRDAVGAGATVIVNINASPYHRDKRTERERWVRRHAVGSGLWVAYVNAVGGQDSLVFDGDSMIAGPDGAIVARGAQFAEDLVVVDLEVDPADDAPVGTAALPDTSGERPPLPDREDPPRLDPVAEVWEALVLGTRDYCAKNGFERAVLGLSGGIDSSVTAAIAADALGADNVLGVFMPSPFTADESLSGAQELSTNLGTELLTIPIEPLMEGFDDVLEETFAGRERDVTEENIQARIRGTLLMALSNKLGHLVLATGNKSESAVGFATLYGDMAGGFAPLLDVEKQLVYELARHRNRRGPAIPESVIQRPPSAELAPGQEDEDRLPPYEVLDDILRQYVEEVRGVDEIVASGHEEETVREVMRMVDAAEFKRRQAAPGVKISERSFGEDRRMPITNAWRH